MTQQPIVYPIKRHTVSIYEMSAGTTVVHRNLSTSLKLPDTLVIGFVSADALNGNYVKNPFNFITKNCSNASLYIDGKRLPPNGYNPNYEARDAHQAYQELVQFSRLQGLITNGIAYDDFMKGGNALWLFNLNETRKGTNAPSKEGSLSFKLEFPPGKVDENVSIIVFQIFSSCIMLYNNGNCVMDWQ